MGRKSKVKQLPPPAVAERPENAAAGPAARSRAGNRFAPLAICALLMLAVAAVWGQTADHEFINFDDNEYIYENRHIQQGLTRDCVGWALTTYAASNWHPLTWMSHALDWQLFGSSAGGHHLTSALLHAAAALLLFLTLRRMTGLLWPSAWVAAIFAIHPLRVESVAWAAERKDVLSGFFFMLTLWFYARYAERPTSWSRYLLVAISFALGLAAKPMLVTLPFVLLLLDYWPLRRLENTPRLPLGQETPSLARPANSRQAAYVRVLVEKIPLFMLTAIGCALTLAAQAKGITPLQQLDLSQRLVNCAIAYVDYLGKMICPINLAVLYPLSKEPTPLWEALAAVALLAAISTAAVIYRRKCPYLLVGWLWYLGTLVPVIGLVQVGFQSMADRYTYLPQIGLYIAIAWGAMQLAAARSELGWALATVGVLAIAALMGAAWQQTHYWKNSETLWKHTLACTTNNAVAHHQLGLDLARRDQVDQAMVEYESALKVNPDYAEAHNNLGLKQLERGQVDAAIDHFRKALAIKADEAAFNNMGMALREQGNLAQAIDVLRTGLRTAPNSANLHNNLGLALARQGNDNEAIANYRKALEIKPDNPEARNNLANALMRVGQVNEAIEQFRMALRLKPDYVKARCNLASALSQTGDVDEAINEFQKALEVVGAQKSQAQERAIRAEIAKLQSRKTN